jgi:hypothetical protein
MTGQQGMGPVKNGGNTRPHGQQHNAPSITLPQSGGAIYSIGEDQGPRLVFADGTQYIYLADLSGDGLGDLGRIRNGEVCYWPNLCYGRFSARVTMDNAPCFDSADQFDQIRIRLANTEGSGTTYILNLRQYDAHIYLYMSGNRWSDVAALPHFPLNKEVI